MPRRRWATALLASAALLAGLIADPAAAVVPGANGRIAYVTVVGGFATIWVTEPNGLGGGPVAQGYAPSIAPDGETIAYWAPGDATGQSDLFVVDAGGGSPTNLTTTADRSEFIPRWSPEGDRLVFTSEPVGNPNAREIEVATRLGNALINRVTVAQASGDPDYDLPVAFDWSSTDRIAYLFSDSDMHLCPDDRPPQLWAVNPDGSGRSQVAVPKTHPQDARWSPDGSRLLVGYLDETDCDNPAGRVYEAGVGVMQGGGFDVIASDQTTPAGALPYHVSGAWAPDDTRLLYVAETNNPYGDLRSVATDGTDDHVVTEGVYFGSGPPVDWGRAAADVVEPPAAAFEVRWSDSDPLQVTLDAAPSRGDVDLFSWRFSDGTTQYGPVVTRRFPAAGAYSVELTVVDTEGRNVRTSRQLSRTTSLDWALPERFGEDADGDGLIDYRAGVADVTPAGWAVDFSVLGLECSPVPAFRLWRDGVSVPVSHEGECRTRSDGFPAEGSYDVLQTADASDGFRVFAGARVTVQDWLIAAIGDSVDSGEGNPDVPLGVNRPAAWQERRCHRSAWSRSAQAALELERSDPHTSVTFIHLSCSGATVAEGLLGRYAGVERDLNVEPPQVDTLGKRVGPREIDAVVLSVGANDMQFGPVVETCLAKKDCPRASFDAQRPTETQAGGPTLAEVSLAEFAKQQARYAAAARALAGLAALADPARVYITELFDPLHSGSELCTLKAGALDKSESGWLYRHFLLPLNAAVHRASDLHGWTAIGGIASAFRQHGLCAPQRWVVAIVDAIATIGQPGFKSGILHPNRAGHRAAAGRVLARLRADLYPGGKARSPRSGPDGAGGRPRLPARGLTAGAGGRVPLTLTCYSTGPSCAGAVSLVRSGAGSARRRKRTTLARARFQIRAGRERRLRLRLSRPARKLVRRKRRLGARVVLVNSAPTKSRDSFTTSISPRR